MKILITGTHFTPAVAVINELKKFNGVEIVYVGRKTSLEGDETKSVESKLLPQLGIKFTPLITGRLQRNFTLYTIPSLLKLPIGLIQSIYIILSQKPQVILSFGGYVAVPIVIAGWFASIPVIIHEQTFFPGLANKISAYFANKIAVSFEESGFKGEKVVVTGNPIRKEIVEASLEASVEQKKSLPNILIVGGNQGSHIINLVIEQSLSQLQKIATLYHQTGDSKYKDFERLNKLRNTSYHVFKFINEDWVKILKKADLVISRAGINTLSELALLGKPALVIPIPNKEQNKNAKVFEEIGLSETLTQTNLSEETLIKSVKKMLQNLSNLKKKAKEANKIIIPDAAKRIALETVLLSKKSI